MGESLILKFLILKTDTPLLSYQSVSLAEVHALGIGQFRWTWLLHKISVTLAPIIFLSAISLLCLLTLLKTKQNWTGNNSTSSNYNFFIALFLGRSYFQFFNAVVVSPPFYLCILYFLVSLTKYTFWASESRKGYLPWKF